MHVMNHLPDHAVSAEPRLFVIRRPSDHLPDQSPQHQVIRRDDFVDHMVERRSRLHHLVRREPERPTRTAGAEQPPDHVPYEAPQRLFGRHTRESLAQIRVWRMAYRQPQNLFIKFGFVAEVVVDGGDVRPRPAADLAHRRAVKPLFREHVPRGLEQFCPGRVCGRNHFGPSHKATV